MIIGLIHKGSGIGDQLFSYIATRVRALDLGVDFGFVGKEFFKGSSFVSLDWGVPTNISYSIDNNSGAVKPIYGGNEYKEYVLNKPHYDPEFNFIPDGSIIDGYGAQDSRYFKHRHFEIKQWLKTEWKHVPDNVCVINFRGGEFAAFPELFLTKEYWDEAIRMMKEKRDDMQFEVHTDDPETAKRFFPDFPIIRNIKENWRAVRYARYLIVSNSAFAIIPALLNENVKKVIAPRYWARRNIKQWSMPSNYYKKFTYI